MIRKKRILITGGAGSIGSELVRQLAPKNKIFILDKNETGAFDLREELKRKGYWVHSRTGDVTNKDTVWDVFSDFKPQIIFHAAALKHVTPNNEYPEEAFATNINGTVNIVREAKNWECFEKLVFISTDKVVNAKCIMGITKLCAESYVKLQGEKFVAVRFGNVLGSQGSVIPIWQRQTDQNESITITDPAAERYFMTIEEACALVIEAAGMKDAGGHVVVTDMGKRVNILELAKEIIHRTRGEIEMIGLRPGEEVDERLMTDDEEKRAIRVGRFFII